MLGERADLMCWKSLVSWRGCGFALGSGRERALDAEGNSFAYEVNAEMLMESPGNATNTMQMSS